MESRVNKFECRGKSKQGMSSARGDVPTPVGSTPIASLQSQDRVARHRKSSMDATMLRSSGTLFDEDTGYERAISDSVCPLVLARDDDVSPVALAETSLRPSGVTASPRSKGLEEALARLGARLAPVVRRLSTRAFAAPALADAFICAEGAEFPCHRLLLACSSEYFARLFEEFPSSKAGILRVEVHGSTSTVVQEMLRILYFDSSAQEVLEERPRGAIELYCLAKVWLLPEVVAEVQDFLLNDDIRKDDLIFLVEKLGYSDEMQGLRRTCEQRLLLLIGKEQRAEAEENREARARDRPAHRDEEQPLEDRCARWPVPSPERPGCSWTTLVRAPGCIAASSSKRRSYR